MEGSDCCVGACSRCWSMTIFVTGLLVLLNQYWLGWLWWTFIGALLTFYGLMGMIWPKCPHCSTCCISEKKEKGKSKK